MEGAEGVAWGLGFVDIMEERSGRVDFGTGGGVLDLVEGWSGSGGGRRGWVDAAGDERSSVLVNPLGMPGRPGIEGWSIGGNFLAAEVVKAWRAGGRGGTEGDTSDWS